MPNQNVMDSRFVRRIVGFAKIGAMVQPVLVKDAQAKYQSLVDQGLVAASDTMQTAAVLRNLAGGILPAEATCREAMREIDTFLSPMRQDERAASSMLASLPTRERG